MTKTQVFFFCLNLNAFLLQFNAMSSYLPGLIYVCTSSTHQCLPLYGLLMAWLSWFLLSKQGQEETLQNQAAYEPSSGTQ